MKEETLKRNQNTFSPECEIGNYYSIQVISYTEFGVRFTIRNRQNDF